jgi:hypothetical protein
MTLNLFGDILSIKLNTVIIIKTRKHMINLDLLLEKEQEIANLTEFFDGYKLEQKEKVVELFKSLIPKLYQVGLSLLPQHCVIKKDEITLYVIEKSPIPTEQDTGLTFVFDTTNISELTSKEDLYNAFVSGNKGYLTLV